MKAHELDQSGKIINTVIVDDLSVFPNLVDASIGGSIGDSIINDEVIKAIPAKIVPEKVTRRQALQALALHTPSILASDIEDAITTHLSGQAQLLALIEWRESQEFERARPLVNNLGPLLGLTQSQMDDLFIVASKL